MTKIPRATDVRRRCRIVLLLAAGKHEAAARLSTATDDAAQKVGAPQKRLANRLLRPALRDFAEMTTPVVASRAPRVP